MASLSSLRLHSGQALAFSHQGEKEFFTHHLNTGEGTAMQPRYDLVSHTIRFCRSLRGHGLLVGPSETADAIQSLGLVDLMDRDQVYWALRTILVSRMDEIAAFDDCFWQFWTFRLPQPASPGLPAHPEAGVIRYSRQRARVNLGDWGTGEAGPPMVSIVRTGASPVEVMASRDLTALQRNDLAEVSQIAARMIRALPARPGRRRRRHRRKGVPDLRGAFRLSLSYNGELIVLPRRRRVPRTLASWCCSTSAAPWTATSGCCYSLSTPSDSRGAAWRPSSSALP